MASQDRVRVALLGLGRMGTVHARAIARVPGITVAAFAEPNDQLAERAKALLGADVKRYTDAREALEHSGLDACIIVTPTPTHAELATAALELGLNVFCEKPLSLDVSSGDAVQSVADRSDRVFQIGFWRRFSPPWARARQAIISDAIGEPVIARSQSWDARLPALSFSMPTVSGGLLIDFGIHDYDIVEWLTAQQVQTVETRKLRLVEPAVGEIGDLDNALVLLQMSGGVQGVVELSANVRYGDDIRAEVLGSAGVVLVEALPSGRAVLGNEAGFAEIPGSATTDTFVAGVAAELWAFARSIREENGSDHLPGGRDSTRALAVGLAARASLQLQRPVALSETLSGRISSEEALGPLPASA